MSLLDACYRRLFNHRILLQDLLGTILEPALCRHLDLRGAVALSPAHVSPSMQTRYGDLAWSVPLTDCQEPALLICIEHQSRPDRHMALRIAIYSLLQLESLAQQSQAAMPLPQPLNLVLYSGKQAWTAATCTQDLFSPSHSLLPPGHKPQQAYLLIDLKQQTLKPCLQPMNLFRLICRIQHNQGLDDLNKLIQTVLDTCSDVALLRDLATWINQTILPRCLPRQDLPHQLHLKDIRAMLEDNSDSWLHQWEAQGIAKGLEKGLYIQRSTLARMIRHKFGSLPATRKQQLEHASSRQLAHWSLQLLDALTLDEVFLAKARTSLKRS